METMIKCLPKEVQAKLRSGIAVPSLQHCVEELVLNSIDAEATCVGVRMDMEAFKVQVIDNGAGMNAEDMEVVGSRYCTSKCHSVEDLDNLSFHGFRGEALASIVSLATLVEISSRTRTSVKTYVKIFKDGLGRNVFETENSRPSAGTTVILCNIFFNMPVRRKRMDPVLEGERIRHRVEAISLMHPSVSFTLKNDGTGAMLVQLPKARNTYHRFVQIHGLSRAQNLREINHTLRQFKVTGYIGREGHYNNSLQFLYVNDRLLFKTRIHKLLNFLLRRLSSSNQKNDSPEGQSAIRSPKHKRSQELHGVYILNIKCSYSEYDICLEPAKTLIEFKEWDIILLCIEEAVRDFLKRENLMAVTSQDDFDDESCRLFSSYTADQEGHNCGIDGQAIGSAFTLDCGLGVNLASVPVHRKKDDDVSKKNASPECGSMECKDEPEQLRQKEITANELENTQSVGWINKECRAEPMQDPVGLEPASYNNSTQEKEIVLGKTDECGQISRLSSAFPELEHEKQELSQKSKLKLNDVASTSSVTSPDSLAQQDLPDLNCMGQTIPNHQGTGEQTQTVVRSRKISLSDPFIHESLQTPDPAQIGKSVSQQVLGWKNEERTLALKHKVSQDASHDRSCQKLNKDLPPVIPSKIPRISSCPKLSLFKGSGSLEKFRRVYGKSDELKLTARGAQENNPNNPQTDRFVLTSEELLLCHKDVQECGATVQEETPKSRQSPPADMNFTILKPVPAQIRGNKSLAAKLYHLKQHEMNESTVLQHSFGTNGCQDSNNNQNPCDTAVTPLEPVPGCSMNFPLAQKEEGAVPGDWLPHFDTSVGKTVYVNKVTGLSRFEDPLKEETNVHCTSDVTNMAVNVISETGEWTVFLYVSAVYGDVISNW